MALNILIINKLSITVLKTCATLIEVSSCVEPMQLGWELLAAATARCTFATQHSTKPNASLLPSALAEGAAAGAAAAGAKPTMEGTVGFKTAGALYLTLLGLLYLQALTTALRGPTGPLMSATATCRGPLCL